MRLFIPKKLGLTRPFLKIFFLILLSIVFYGALFFIYKYLLKAKINIIKLKINKVSKILIILSLLIIVILFRGNILFFSISSITIILLLLYKNKFESFIVALMYFGIFYISKFYGVSYRHTMIFSIFIFIYAIYTLEKNEKSFSILLSLIISSFLIITMNISYISRFKNDINNDYSSGYKVASYIRENNFDNKEQYLIVAIDSSTSGSISPYFDEKIFYNPDIDEYISFTDWLRKWRYNMKNIDKLPRDKEIIFVHYSNKEVDNEKLEKIEDFIGGESFYLYKLKSIISQRTTI